MNVLRVYTFLTAISYIARALQIEHELPLDTSRGRRQAENVDWNEQRNEIHDFQGSAGSSRVSSYHSQSNDSASRLR